MHQKKLKLCAFLLLSLGLTGLKAQVANPASGGSATGSGGSASYSVGQVIYTTNTGTTGSMAQGVQQAFEISVVTGLAEADGITLQCSAYPNPATDNVKLIIENFKTEKLNYQLFDINGKVLENNVITGNQTNIDMSNLAIATYFLKITQGNKEVKTFKIIKK